MVGRNSWFRTVGISLISVLALGAAGCGSSQASSGASSAASASSDVSSAAGSSLPSSGSETASEAESVTSESPAASAASSEEISDSQSISSSSDTEAAGADLSLFDLSSYEGTTVRLGIMGASDETVWDPIVADFKDLGITIEYVYFTDYTQPNAALANGDIDLNSFQHYKYLNNEKAQFGYDITPVGDTLITALNLYSKKVTSIEEIPEGGQIAIPNDAVNEERALDVIQASGLISLDPDAEDVTPDAITDNPKNIDFVETDASQTASLLPDVDAAIVNGAYAIDAGLSPHDDSIYYDDPSAYKDKSYVNVIAARTEDADSELYKAIVADYQTDRTKQIYIDAFQGMYIPAWDSDLPEPAAD